MSLWRRNTNSDNVNEGFFFFFLLQVNKQAALRGTQGHQNSLMLERWQGPPILNINIYISGILQTH